MAIGDYQHLVTLDATDGAGGMTPLDPPTWYCAFNGDAADSVTLIGPWRPDITTATRVTFKGRIYQVTAAVNRDEQDVVLILTCTEVFD